MNVIEFQTRNLAELSAAKLAALVKTSSPAYLAIESGQMLYIQADGESASGTTDESSLPSNRIAIRKVVVFAKDGENKPRVAVAISFRRIGEMDDGVTNRLIGNLASKLAENANDKGATLLQTKVDVQQDADTSVAVYRMNGGGNYKVEDAARYFGFEDITAIDAATGKDTTRHQLVIAGQKDGSTPTIARFNPHTGSQIDAEAQISLPKGATKVASVAIDRRTLILTMLVVSDTKIEGFANENGTSDVTKVKDLDGAESLRMKKTGLYAFNKKGETVYFQRKGEGQIDLMTGNIVLSGTDPSVFRLHDINVEDDRTTGRTKRTATFTARDSSATGARQWNTQALAA